jgi:anti-sigma factor RsiW
MADPTGAMGEPRGAVAVSDTAAKDTVANNTIAEGTVARNHSARNSPDALVAEIEHTRDDLARTIDALADRVSPASNVRRLRDELREQATRPEVQLGAAAAGAFVVGLALLSIWARRRRGR